jgi:hypothetical protein
MVYVPFFPSTAGWTMPRQPFEALLATQGVRMTWLKSHSCPCVYGGSTPTGYLIAGAPDPACTRCHGYGTYWDAPVGPFTGLITYFASAPSPIEPGIRSDDAFGPYIDAQPVVTVPFASPFNAAGSPAEAQAAVVWQNASILDMFVEVDATARYNAFLEQGGNQVLPFQQNLSVAAAGAVTVYDGTNRAVDVVVGYTVTGTTVSLPAGMYPDGTHYVVEFIAAPVYVAHKAAGALPHVRPLGAGTVNLPRRFHIQTLDMWTRQSLANVPTSYPVLGF